MTKTEIHNKVQSLDNATFVAFVLSLNGTSMLRGIDPKRDTVIDDLVEVAREELSRRNIKLDNPEMNYKLGLGTEPVFIYLGFKNWDALVRAYN